MIKEKSTGSMCLDRQPNSANSKEQLSIVTVVLPERLIKQLDALAKQRSWKRSEALALAISNFINDQAQG